MEVGAEADFQYQMKTLLHHMTEVEALMEKITFEWVPLVTWYYLLGVLHRRVLVEVWVVFLSHNVLLTYIGEEVWEECLGDERVYSTGSSLRADFLSVLHHHKLAYVWRQWSLYVLEVKCLWYLVLF